MTGVRAERDAVAVNEAVLDVRRGYLEPAANPLAGGEPLPLMLGVPGWVGTAIEPDGPVGPAEESRDRVRDEPLGLRIDDGTHAEVRPRRTHRVGDWMGPALPLEQGVHRGRPALGMLPGCIVEGDADVLADFDAGIATKRQFLVIAERGRPHAGEIDLLSECRGRAEGERQRCNDRVSPGRRHSTLRSCGNIPPRDRGSWLMAGRLAADHSSQNCTPDLPNPRAQNRNCVFQIGTLIDDRNQRNRTRLRLAYQFNYLVRLKVIEHRPISKVRLRRWLDGCLTASHALQHPLASIDVSLPRCTHPPGDSGPRTATATPGFQTGRTALRERPCRSLGHEAGHHPHDLTRDARVDEGVRCQASSRTSASPDDQRTDGRRAGCCARRSLATSFRRIDFDRRGGHGGSDVIGRPDVIARLDAPRNARSARPVAPRLSSRCRRHRLWSGGRA